MQDKRFQISGLNSHFPQDIHSFQQHITQSRHMIAATRTDLNQKNHNYVIDANAPFELQPKTPDGKNGVLLVHGLYDSPYSLRALAHHFQQQNFLVRVLLLPGHGSVPGDLLDVTYQDWIDAVHFGVNSFSDRVENVYYVGFSTGGTLGIYLAQQQLPLKGLILFAPAIKIKSPLVRLSTFSRYWRCLGAKSQWYTQAQDQDYSRYESITFNSIEQIYRLTQLIRENNRQQKINSAILSISSADDEVINHNTVLRFMRQQNHPENRTLVYTKNTTQTPQQCMLRNSHYPNENIVDFSHQSLLIPPEDSHYGRQGDYQDFRHYQGLGRFLAPASQETIYKGAASLRNIRQHYLNRLTYNPDFNHVLVCIDEFIKESL